MRSRKTLAHVGLAIVGAAALGLGVVTPAAAHTDSLFTGWVVYSEVEEASVGQFATISKTDASITPFGPSLPADLYFNAIEIYNETGYAIGYVDGFEDVDSEVIFTWNHSTGVAGTPIVVTTPGALVTNVYSLDTVVNGDVSDGTLLVYADLEDEEGIETTWVGSVDPATGVFTPLVDLSDENVPNYLDSLATDPTTGITYALVDEDDGMPQFLILDLAAGTWTGPTNLTGIQAALTGGWIMGADFDAAGALWFYYSDGVLATTTGVFGATVSARAIGQIPGSEGASIVSGALTVDPAGTTPPGEPAPAAPTLPATGVSPDAGLTGALLLFALGTIAVIVRRRAATA